MGTCYQSGIYCHLGDRVLETSLVGSLALEISLTGSYSPEPVVECRKGNTGKGGVVVDLF